MYELFSGKRIYEKDEVDSAIEGVVSTAANADTKANEANTKANAALAETDRIKDAYNMAEQAFNKMDTYDTAITNTLSAATNAVTLSTQASTKAQEALEKADVAYNRPPVKYVAALPEHAEDVVYGIKHSGTITTQRNTTFIDIIGTYFTRQSEGKYITRSNYTVYISDAAVGSISVSGENINCYTNKDFTGMLPDTYNTYDFYNFTIIESVDHTDYYVGNSTLNIAVKLAAYDTVENNFIPRTEKGAPSGIAILDTTGHIPYSLLPVNSTVFRGTWDASTGVYPTGHVTPGDFFIVTVAGTVDGVEYLVDDRIYWTGEGWSVTHAPEGVTSINGRKGIVVLTAADVGALPTDNPTFNGILQQNTCTADKKSIALGDNSTAQGNYSIAVGSNCYAKGDYSMAVGVRNVIDSDYLFVIGNGTISKRDNAFAVDINNNTFVRHELYRVYSAMHGPKDDLMLTGNFRYMSKVVWGNDIIYDKNAVDYTGHADTHVVVYDGERVNVVFMSALAEGVDAYNIDCIVENTPTVANLEDPEYCVYRVYKISVFNTTEAPITFNVNSKQFSVLDGGVIATYIPHEYTVPPMVQLSILVVNERQFEQKIGNAIWN